jgi:hypothetical protein
MLRAGGGEGGSGAYVSKDGGGSTSGSRTFQTPPALMIAHVSNHAETLKPPIGTSAGARNAAATTNQLTMAAGASVPKPYVRSGSSSAGSGTGATTEKGKQQQASAESTEIIIGRRESLETPARSPTDAGGVSAGVGSHSASIGFGQLDGHPITTPSGIQANVLMTSSRHSASTSGAGLTGGAGMGMGGGRGISFASGLVAGSDEPGGGEGGSRSPPQSARHSARTGSGPREAFGPNNGAPGEVVGQGPSQSLLTSSRQPDVVASLFQASGAGVGAGAGTGRTHSTEAGSSSSGVTTASAAACAGAVHHNVLAAGTGAGTSATSGSVGIASGAIPVADGTTVPAPADASSKPLAQHQPPRKRNSWLRRRPKVAADENTGSIGASREAGKAGRGSNCCIM